MSEHYQIAVFLPHDSPASEVVPATHAVMTSAGATIEDDCYLFLNEADGDDPPPEPITSAEAALTRLTRWPGHGALAYVMPEAMVNVSFEGEVGASNIEAVVVSIPEGAFDRGGTESLDRYSRLAATLHDRLGAARTILAWAPGKLGLTWEAETERLRRGVFSGSFPMLDLRHNG